CLEPTRIGIGATVSGIDLATDVDTPTRAWIYRTVLEHGVLLFRDQDLDPPAFHDFARGFGPLQRHVLRKYRHRDYPDLSWLTNVEEDGSIDRFGVTRATAWHTDGSFTDTPPALGILHALEVPSKGAGTLFVNMRNAYEDLADAEKQRLGGIVGLHRHGAGPGGGMYDNALDEDQDENHLDIRHPVVRPHPATGAPVLYVSTTHTRCFEGETMADSGPAIMRLVEDATRPESVFHHHWRPGDVLMWDEHGTMHRGEGAYDPAERRVMLRAIVQSVD
ncbi:MAG: TauD/TfdA family dioxygenase, partial [Pseudomonadota bacterium]